MIGKVNTQCEDKTLSVQVNTINATPILESQTATTETTNIQYMHK